MRKLFFSIAAVCCLLCGCSDSSHSDGCKNSGVGACPNQGVGCLTSDLQYEFDVCQKSDCPENALCPNKKSLSLYYDTPRSVIVFYNAKENAGVALTAQGNECVEFLKNQTDAESSENGFPLTDEKGLAVFTMKAKKYDCENGENVKICLVNNPETCAEIKVSTTNDTEKIDTNHNLMIDEYEDSADKDKYTNYVPGDCDSYCHTDDDCPDSGFCDSASGYQCSRRCTSEDQCLKYQNDDGSWAQMKCRADGRCAYPEFKVVYAIANSSTETTITMGGHTSDPNATVDWGDGSPVETIPTTTNNNLSHSYPASKSEKEDAKLYTVTITGDYRDWTANCSPSHGIDLYDVQQFGEIGLGDDGNREHGSFTGCMDLQIITAKDIPDSTKMTSMNSMFGGLDVLGKTAVGMKFNHDAVTRWDTSNVTSMYRVFFNAGEGSIKNYPGFNQDIGRWNTSKVTTIADMFNGAVKFNANIGCWDTSNVTNISNLFFYAVTFNHDLSKWNLDKVTSDGHSCVFRAENGHNGDISINNYCKLRALLPGTSYVDKEMGREGSPSNGTKCIEEKFWNPKTGLYSGSTCCGVGGSAKDTVCGKDGLDQGRTCDNPTLKDSVIQRCLNEYILLQKSFHDEGEPKAYKDMGPDDVTCAHLRRCRDCPAQCDSCFKNCKANRNPGEDCAGVEGCPVGGENGAGKVTLSSDGKRLITWVSNGNTKTVCSCEHLL